MFFVIASRRAAVFVVSPTVVYSSRRSDPTVPDTIGPLLRPMPTQAVAETLLPQPSVEPRQARMEHLAGCGQGAIGVVRHLDRRSENGHDSVAHICNERPSVVEDRIAHLADIAIQHLDDDGRGQTLQQRP